MKISYRTHPVIKSLFEKDYNIPISSKDYKIFLQNNEWHDFEQNFERSWDLVRQNCASNIDIITEPFFNAVKDNVHKLIDAQLYKELPSHSGVFIYNKASFCYYIEITDQGIYTTIIAFHGDLLSFYGTNFKVHYCHKELRERYNTFDSVYVMKRLYAIIEMIVLFKKYAAVEICNLKPGQRKKEISIKYINETGISVNILDSKWFTTLVKSDAFKVRGHFRLQPCGEGLIDRKLIWINEFQKEGYTALARKISNT